MSVQLEKPNEKFHVLDWEDAELQKWVEEIAKKRQEVYYQNNEKTESFQYSDTELDVIQLRVCQTLFGLKLSEPNSDNQGFGMPRGTAHSMLKEYSWKERRKARNLQVKIIQYGKTSEEHTCINLNKIFVSCAFYDAGNLISHEITVFILGKGDKKCYLDTTGRNYSSWEAFLTENTLPKGVMIYPKDGNYTPKCSDVVILNARETPVCKPLEQAKECLDKTVVVGSVACTALSMAPVAVPAVLSVAAAYVGTGIIAHSAIKGIGEFYDKVSHGESAKKEAFTVALSVFTAASQIYIKTWTERLAKNVVNNELWSDISKGISKSQKIIFATQNLSRIALSSVSVYFSMQNILNKKNRSWSDWKNLAVSLFCFANVIAKPITLQALFESEQGKYIQQFKKKVISAEAVEEFKKTVENAKTTEEKTYLIRNLEKIEDLDEHFYRIHETGSVVDYTENGMIINDAVTVSPETNIILPQTSRENSDIILQNLQKLLNNSNTILQNSQTIWNIFKEIQNNPGMILKNPKNILKIIEKFIKNPEMVSKFVQQFFENSNAEKVSKIIKEIMKNSEIILEFIQNIFENGKIMSKISEMVKNLKFETIFLMIVLIVKNREKMLKIVKIVQKNPRKMFDILNLLNSTSFSKDVETFPNIVETLLENTESILCENSEQIVKTEIEQFFGVSDYRKAQVGGREIFKNLTTNDSNVLFEAIKKLPTNSDLKRKYFEITCKIVDDSNCHLKAESPHQFAEILMIVRKMSEKRQTIRNLPEEQIENEELFLNAVLDNAGSNYLTIKTRINQIYETVSSEEQQIELLTIESEVRRVIENENIEETESVLQVNRTFHQSQFVVTELFPRTLDNTSVSVENSTDPTIVSKPNRTEWMKKYQNKN